MGSSLFAFGVDVSTGCLLFWKSISQIIRLNVINAYIADIDLYLCSARVAWIRLDGKELDSYYCNDLWHKLKCSYYHSQTKFRGLHRLIEDLQELLFLNLLSKLPFRELFE